MVALLMDNFDKLIAKNTQGSIIKVYEQSPVFHNNRLVHPHDLNVPILWPYS